MSIQNSTITITIPGRPRPKQGTKTRAFPTSSGGIRTVHYTPEPVKNWAAYAMLIISQQRQIPLWEGPVRETIIVKKQRPKSRKFEKHPLGKPDLDNLEKNINDVLKGLILKDDSIIVEKISTKIYSDIEETIIILEKIK